MTQKFCPECGLFKPCSTCNKPRALVPLAPTTDERIAELEKQLKAERDALFNLRNECGLGPDQPGPSVFDQLKKAQEALRTIEGWARLSTLGDGPEDEPEPVRMNNKVVAMLCREALKEES